MFTLITAIPKGVRVSVRVGLNGSHLLAAYVHLRCGIDARTELMSVGKPGFNAGKAVSPYSSQCETLLFTISPSAASAVRYATVAPLPVRIESVCFLSRSLNSRYLLF